MAQGHLRDDVTRMRTHIYRDEVRRDGAANADRDSARRAPCSPRPSRSLQASRLLCTASPRLDTEFGAWSTRPLSVARIAASAPRLGRAGSSRAACRSGSSARLPELAHAAGRTICQGLGPPNGPPQCAPTAGITPPTAHLGVCSTGVSRLLFPPPRHGCRPRDHVGADR